jgi:hypothetical protein
MTDLNPHQKLTHQGRGSQGALSLIVVTHIYMVICKPRYRDGNNRKEFV